jgi:hypothetical protein
MRYKKLIFCALILFTIVCLGGAYIWGSVIIWAEGSIAEWMFEDSFRGFIVDMKWAFLLPFVLLLIAWMLYLRKRKLA